MFGNEDIEEDKYGNLTEEEISQLLDALNNSEVNDDDTSKVHVVDDIEPEESQFIYEEISECFYKLGELFERLSGREV